jgi:hypothetical protein
MGSVFQGTHALSACRGNKVSIMLHVHCANITKQPLFGQLGSSKILPSQSTFRQNSSVQSMFPTPSQHQRQYQIRIQQAVARHIAPRSMATLNSFCELSGSHRLLHGPETPQQDRSEPGLKMVSLLLESTTTSGRGCWIGYRSSKESQNKADRASSEGLKLNPTQTNHRKSV